MLIAATLTASDFTIENSLRSLLSLRARFYGLLDFFKANASLVGNQLEYLIPTVLAKRGYALRLVLDDEPARNKGDCDHVRND